MKLFLDSSAFAKRFVEEAGSRDVEALCAQASELCLSVLCVPEIVSALGRRLRERSLSRRDYGEAKEHLASDVRDAVVVNLTPDVIQRTIKVLETTPVRTMDALHIASALAWGADLFATADQRQLSAAKVLGLKVRLV